MLVNNPGVLVYRNCIQRKTWCMGLYAGVDYNSTYFIVNSVVSYPPPTTRVKGWSGEDLSYWYICICLLISITTNRKRESTEKGEGRGES